MEKGNLYIIPTPIGNLDDISKRSIDLLKSVDTIACEDTRNSGMLLQKLGIEKKRLLAYHNYNEKQSANGIIKLILEGLDVGLISDAGYPTISDPGYRLVNECIKNDIKIIAVPGASAILPALAASGFETNSFSFFGFPPAKKGRQTFIKNILNKEETVIIFESVHKIIKLLEQINELDNERQISVSREISKIYEETIRGTSLDCMEHLKNNSIKGEFVVVVERSKK